MSAGEYQEFERY